ncbi:MauE/DoxX family redox-associated membrane protein [Streptomyces sp. JJ36]|uniref:MauE/DoxX family redox-associated membrane protein n=1 Tax=Streptomyces sp. JJ36 TaxID=2736645 RepID=UPI001F183B02|nr:MauE/DoxX family redox-associated membrane protein [Streptomyces sp. JJ36]MCF6525792.1 methylamine utilization protein MauE [Streptomyces sp. JJ36]
MATLLLHVTAGVTLLTLLTGCAAHLARPSALPAALRAHGLLPRAAVPVAGALLPCAEGLAGLAVTAALVDGTRTGLAATLTAAGCLHGVHAGYAARVLAAGRGGPCGCALREAPMSRWVAGRGLALAALALTGVLPALAAGTGDRVPQPAGFAGPALTLLAAATLTVLLWVLPSALDTPLARRAPGAPALRPHPGGPPWTS